MTTVTLWILLTVAGSHRPAAVIERFNSEQQCEAARVQLDAFTPFLRTAACLRVEAAR